MSRLVLLAAAALAGCSIHSRVQLDAGAVHAVEGGSSASIGGDGLVLRSSALGRLFVLGSVFAWAIDSQREDERLRLSPSERGTLAPAADPARAVHSQDCTQPLENPSANLLCR